MYLGIDFGTSGCRAVVIDKKQSVISQTRVALAAPKQHQNHITQQSEGWIHVLQQLFRQLAQCTDLSRIKRLSINGTSATVLLCDKHGTALSPALMYNDNSSRDAVLLIKQHCPLPAHLSMRVTSGLAKAIQLMDLLGDEGVKESAKILSQADFLNNYLCGEWGISDYNNTFNLGFDVEKNSWPDWVSGLLPANALPRVVGPGDIIGSIQTHLARQFGLSEHCQICAGTTDSNAAFIATGSHHPGDAVTSLGTTLVIKILNEQPVNDLESGVYSHKLGDYWLCGGASNAGGGILRQFFSDQQLIDYSRQIDPQHSSGLDYYPLTRTGERFPINDPDKEPLIEPRPESDIEFLHALLEGLSRIEQRGYQKLIALGSIAPSQIQTSGGGAQNPQWRALRQQLLDIPVTVASQTQAAFGSAILALEGLSAYQRST